MKYLGLPLGVKRLKRSYFQYIEDKAAAHLAPLHGRYFNIIGRKTLVNSILTSHAIYRLIALEVHVEPPQSIRKVMRSFFWEGNEKANRRKCKSQLERGLPPYLPWRIGYP
jgi:hypothetical protein